MSQGQLERFDVEYFQGWIWKINFSSFANLWEISEKIQSWSTPSWWNFEKEWILYLKSADFDLFEIQKSQFISQDFHEKLNRSKIIKWDILIASVWATIWKVWYYNLDEEANINQNVARIRIKDKRFIDKFVTIFLYSDLWQKQLLWNSTVNAQPYINNQKISEIKIPLLPLEIQNQIVEKMDFALSEKKQKEFEAKTLLENIDDFVLSELWIKYEEVEEKKVFWLNLSELWETKRIDGFYNNPKFLELEKMLKNGKYEVKKLDEIKEKIITWTTPLSTSEPYWENWIIFFRNTNLEKNNINLDDVKYVKEEFSSKLTYSQLNDVIVCIAWTIWVSAINNVWKIAINQNVSALRLKENILADYVSIFLNNKILVWFFDRVSSVATIKYINNENLLSIFLPLPPLEIQEKIALEVKSKIEKAKVLENEAKEVYESAKREVEKMILD